MVSKNNIQLKDRYATKQVPHYGIRKLSVGVASVLLSTTLYMGVTAHADTIAETNPQPTIDQPASTATGNATGSVQLKPTADQSESTTTNSPASETNASSKPVQTVSPEQSADTTGVQPASDQLESAAAKSNIPENNGSAVSATTVLPKQAANADTQSTATTSGVQPFVNLAVESDNNDLAPKHETIDSTWTLHYVNQADHKQELKDPTVITMQYARTNTLQSDGTTQYGDWSYVPGSFKQTGTPITVKDSDNPVKQDNIDKNGENFDIFTITAMYPTVAGYDFHNGINGTRLRDNLRNNERQADTMSKDFYAEYDVAKPTRETVGSQWRIHYIDSTNREHELKAPTVINMQYIRTNTPQSDGTIQHGDWSYVSGSFKLTGTPITANDSNNPVKEDNVDKNGQNVDTFTINAMYPSITGYNFHDGINNAHLHDYLLNYDPNGTIQAPTMGKDFYVEYDPISERSVAVKFVDDQLMGQQVSQAITLTGHDGDTVNLNLTVPDKYQLADGQQLPATYTFAKGSGNLTIHLTHKVVQREATVNVRLLLITLVRTRSDDGDDAVQDVLTQTRWKQLEDSFGNLEHSNISFEASPFVEVGTLTGHVDYDLVDETVVSLKNDWTSLNLSGHSYELPNGTEVVNGIRIDASDTIGKKLRDDWYLNEYRKWHSDVDPDYITRPWYGYLSVNATNNDNDWIIEEARNLGLQAGLVGDEPNALAKANGDRAATAVEMTNKPIDVGALNTDLFRDQDGRLQAALPVPLAGVYIPYVEKTATRTIKVTTPDGKTTTVKQTATLAKQVDFADDAHPAWTTGEWANYDVPTIPGYTASQSQIAKTAVTGTTEDQTVNITYTANPQTSTVVYQSEDGTPVHTTMVNGHTGQTVKVSNEVPVGWHVVNGTVPSEITFGPNGTLKTVVTIAHSHVTVTPDAPKTISDKLPDNPAKPYPAGVSHDDLNKTVTRTIKVTTPDGQTKTITQTAKLTRTADVDEVTGKVTYSDWTTGYWSAYTAPIVPGYTADYPYIAGQSVDGETEDQTIEITYTANPHTTHVNYVDTQGKLVHTTTVNGQTDQTVKVPSEIPDGWKLVDGQTVSNTITFGPDGHADTSVKIEHKYVTVDPDRPQTNGTKLPDNPAKTFNGVEANDLNKTITRTIKVTTPDGQTNTVAQTAKLTRTADVDEVTGQVTYGDWTTDEWAAYDAPSVAGYVPSQVKVNKETVTAASKDTTTTITYLPTQHQISVEYVDDDDHGKVVKTDQVPGKTDQTITVMPTVPANYELVDSNDRTYTVTSADGQTVQIHVKHHQVKANESKTVTRTINVHTPHDGVKRVKQTVTLNRDVTTDQVTGEKIYGDWTTGQWKAYTPEAIPGYTPSTNEVPNTNVDGISSDQTVDVTYTADAQKFEIVYVDDAKGGVVVKTDQVAGKTDETVKVTPDVPAGYKVVSEVPGSYTLTSDGHQTITVHLRHQKKTTSEDKTVTRTINVHTPHDGVKTIKQTATLTRAVTTDQVTGEKTYGDWSATLWDHYAVPAVAGYVPSIKQVAQQVVNGTTTDQMIDVTYSSGEHTTHINYVDGDGNTVHTTTIKGQTDGTAQVPNEIPAGWTVVGEPVPTELAFGPDGHADVTVTISHKHVTVTPDQPKMSSDKLPDNPAKTYPSGVGHDDLNKTITRTIKITTPDGQTRTVEQTAKLTRTADVDEVIGEVTYGGWTTGEWSNYDVSVVPGYTSSQSEVPATKVTDDTKDQTVTIGYTANDQTTTINYIDQNGKVVHTTVVNGHTDQTVKVPSEVPAGWTITNGQVPNEITFGPDGHADVTVTVGHQHVTVTPDKPQTDGTKLPDNPSQTFHGVAETDLNKTITRTIKVTTPAGKTDTIKQTAKLTRTADVDEVTCEVTYGKWTTGAWSSYAVPTVAGYTPSQAVVAEVAVNADMTDQTVEITYTADSHTSHINYVDEDGKVVHTTTVTGQTDQTVKVPNETPAGWMTTGQVPSEVTFGPDGYTDVTITVDHRHVTVTPDDPKTDGAKLPDNPTLTFHGVDEGDLNKTVMRTIKLNAPGQDTQVITQTAHLTRTATVDEVTGEVTYGDWTSGQWDAYEVPTVDGYTASQTTIPAVKVTSETTSQDIVIDYIAVPKAQTASSNNQTDENQVTPEKVTTGTVQETKQDAIKNSAQSTMQGTKQLPQTGNDNRAGLLSLIGSSLMASLAIFGLGKKKKHEN